ncbi:MAG: STAS domain-containing protein [Sphingomonadales bacterium]
MTTFETRNGVTYIKVGVPRLDAAAAPAFKTDLVQNVTGQPDRVVVDVSEVEFMDSTGLGVFVSLLKLMSKEGRIAVAGPSPGVRKLIEVTRLDRLFPLHATIGEAEAAVGG